MSAGKAMLTLHLSLQKSAARPNPWKQSKPPNQGNRKLWDARKEAKLDNLRGVRDETLDGVLHPLVLEYLRAVECNGMVARHPGSKARVEAGLHPNAKSNLDQVYKQIFKDVRKHRVLVVKRSNQRLGTTVSSPFEAVDKMLPDRSIAPRQTHRPRPEAGELANG